MKQNRRRQRGPLEWVRGVADFERFGSGMTVVSVSFAMCVEMSETLAILIPETGRRCG